MTKPEREFSATLHVRVTKALLARLSRAAAKQRRRTSEYIRLSLEHATQHDLKEPTETVTQ